MRLKWKRIGSLFLSVCIVVTMLPTVAFAEESNQDLGMPKGISSITTFANLDESIATQTVKVGTIEEELNLPTELTATVTTVSAITTDSNGSNAVTGEQNSEANEQDDENIPIIAAGSEAQEQEVQESQVQTKKKEITIAVSGWTCEPAYDGTLAGNYVFTPVLTLADGLSIADDATIPQITVMVQEAPALLSIRGAASDAFQVEGGDTYATLEEAAAAVPDGGTITMLDDVEVSDDILLNYSKTYTIDFGGYTLQRTSNDVLLYIIEGMIWLKNGTVKSIAADPSAQYVASVPVRVSYNPVVFIESGNYYGYRSAIESSYYVIIESGTFHNEATNRPCLGSEVRLAEGSVASPAKSEWTKDTRQVTVTAGSEVDITPPAFTMEKVERTSNNKAMIRFSAEETAGFGLYYLVLDKDAPSPTKEEVRAGMILGSMSSFPRNLDVTLSAGAKDVYAVGVDNAGNISQPVKIAVNAITETFRVEGGDTYTTLEEAAQAVPDGGTITMLREVTVKKPSYMNAGIDLNVNKNYTIDFGGNALRSGDNSRIRFNLLAIKKGSVVLKNGTIKANKDNAQGLYPSAVGAYGEGTTLDIINMNISGSDRAIESLPGGRATLWSGNFKSLIPPNYAMYEENGQIVLASGSTANPKAWKSAVGVTVTAAQDTTPPTITASGTRTSETKATLRVTSNEYGRVYYLAKETGLDIPNSEQVKTNGKYLGTIEASATLDKSSITIPASTVQIYVVVEDLAGNISLPSTALPIISAELPEIQEQPANASYMEGDTALPLTVTVSSISDGGTLSYQWYKNTTNSTEGGTAVGTNTASYTPDISAIGTLYYFVVVKNTNNDVNGNTETSVTSSVAAVKVDKKSLAGLNQTLYVKAGLPQPQSYTLDLSSLLPSGINPDKVNSYDFGLSFGEGDVSILQSKGIANHILTVTIKSNAAAGVQEGFGITFTSNHYTISESTVTLHSTTKTPVKVSGVTVENRIEDGTPITASGTPVFTNAVTNEAEQGLTPIYTWSKAVSQGDPTLPGAPKEPGHYILTVTADGGTSYDIMPLSVGFEIIAAPVIPDDEKPFISSVSPTSTGVAISGTVSITFSETMDTSVGGTVFLNDIELVEGRKWDGESKTVSIAYNGLAKGTTYTVKISGFQDAVGNPMVAVTEGYTFITDSDGYLVTLVSVGRDPEGGGYFKEGESVPVKAGRPLSGMRFKGWSANPAITFTDATSAETSFTMPAGAVTVTAHFEAVSEDLFLLSVFGDKNLALGEIDSFDASGTQTAHIPVAVNLPDGTTKIGANDVKVKSNVKFLGFSNKEQLIKFMSGKQTPENIAFMSANMIDFYKQNMGYDFDPAATTPLATDGVTEIYLYAVHESDDQLYKIAIGKISDAAAPVITRQPQSATVKVGQNVTLSVEASVSDGGTLSYEWQESTDGNIFTFITDATEASFTPPTTAIGTMYYFCTVTNTNNSANGDKTAIKRSDAVTVTVQSSGGGGGGGSTGGGSSSGGGTPSEPTVTTPPATAENPKPATEVTTTVSPTISNGTVNATVNSETMNSAIAKAQAEAKKNGTSKNGIMVEIKVDTKNTKAENITTNLLKASVDALVKADTKEVRITSEIADISLNLDTLKEIQKQVGADVNVTAKKVDNSTLSAEAKKIVGNRPVYDFAITGTNGKKVTDFGKGKVSVSIPYTLGANENAANVVAYYIDSKGNITEMPNSVYDPVTKTLSFVTDHFSKFAVGYKTTTIRFTDITNHWAKDSIEFVAARGLLNGTSKTTFSPNTAMTRGMFVAALGRLAEIDTAQYTKSSFTDVKANAYYMPYVEWASKNGIVSGIGNGKFAPDQSITREQMAFIMANYAKAITFELPKVHAENIFSDNAKIGSYAKTAVKQMQMAGVLNGKNDNMFDPQGTATRAEVSAVLKRFVELAINTDTAED